MKSFLLLIIFMIIIGVLFANISFGNGCTGLTDSYKVYYELTNSDKVISAILTLLIALSFLILNIYFALFSVKTKKFKIILTIINTILPLVLAVFIAVFYSVTPLFLKLLNNSSFIAERISMEDYFLLLCLFPIIVYIIFIKKTIDYSKDSINKE